MEQVLNGPTTFDGAKAKTRIPLVGPRPHFISREWVGWVEGRMSGLDWDFDDQNFNTGYRVTEHVICDQVKTLAAVFIII